MWKKLILVLVIMCMLIPRLGHGQDAKTALAGVTKSMGDPKTLQYTASGTLWQLGQSPYPGTSWPRFNIKSQTRVVNYDTVSMRDEVVRTQGENPPRGGGIQPIIGEQRQILLVSGTYAWNQAGENAVPAPAAAADRLQQLWLTPHGVMKAAIAHNATVQAQTEGGKKMTAISFAVPGQLKVKALVNENNLIEKVEAWSPNPVLGDMLTETTYTDTRILVGCNFRPRSCKNRAASLRLS